MYVCVCVCVCVRAGISMCVRQEATRAVGAEWGFMMKFSGNLKSPIIEPESEKKMEKMGGKGREVGREKIGGMRERRRRRRRRRRRTG